MHMLQCYCCLAFFICLGYILFTVCVQFIWLFTEVVFEVYLLQTINYSTQRNLDE